MLPRTPPSGLQGRRALVTGASRGIGLAAAAALAQAGAAVTLAARSQDELRQACDQIRTEGGTADFMVVDVTDARAVDAQLAERPPYQVLVNSAGMNRPKPLVDVTDDDIDAVLDLNVKAAFYVSRAVSRRLLAERLTGSLINISSQMGVVGSPRRTLYCASKHAIEGMTKALAWELGSAGIRVNTLCPTFIETAMTAGMFADDGFRGWVLERIALGRLGRLDEIMGAVVFLAGDASSLMTGSALMLDGGWSAA
ncbi:SDR family NAD(P)-dependent oxidoreductase [Hydrogenophaga sp. BPS33]|uniref:SDR family NAD(P)-dependent oxidoreductase n=1 Tax=Hydrogenophaga sp. BPS33 TaxID=2651974 RepID=UPI0013203BF1|nr:SDR family NAD(P)-dependent oxidoreductase [Hydrogenophaga sp. BPS33]QHE88595.1 SDR family oxidoreductase [Hydrogenophaga sp. BPS33]